MKNKTTKESCQIRENFNTFTKLNNALNMRDRKGTKQTQNSKERE